jgi:DNA-binding NarL/FixJ family response regulator
MQQQGNRRTPQHQPKNCQTAFADSVLESRNYSRPQASQTGNRHVCKGADGIMQPRDQLTQKEIHVATLVWEGLTNRDIAKVIGTSEQVVKNYLRTTFDKLGVWSRLELALYVASHGGVNWVSELGLTEKLSERHGVAASSVA